VRVLLLDSDDWANARLKGKIPRPRVDIPVLRIVAAALARRLAEYPTSMEVRQPCPTIRFIER
jgi:hypothetical protein